MPIALRQPMRMRRSAGRSEVEQIVRARTVRDELRARPGAPDPVLLAELYDLLDLAAAG